ncbi:MAG TPA: M14 family zinc carboxypeptidase [Bacteroidales bacterium]|nr:M14 family zinc carboxypeptidase [Bacteroidales bacterium]
MMKKSGFLALFLLLVGLTYSQTGWRKGEMEIKIHLNSQKEADLLHTLNLNAETASPDGSIIEAYVVPDELTRVQQAGLHYQIIIPDLIEHSAHFWDALVPSGYMTYQQIVDLADSLATNYPSICKKVIFGTSVGGRELGALKISDNVNTDEPEAEILFDAGIHGDEIMSPEIVIRYARYLCLGYGTDSVYTSLVNNHEIWLYYMVNPDGRVNMSRYNNHGVDCNRDAGYMWNAEGNSISAFSQVESRALRDCMLQSNAAVYTNYHGGTEIISYPWSYRPSAATDYPQMDQLASVYSNYSGYTSLPYGQGFNIMYAINGSNKDFQYGSMGNIGWSIEITNDKEPASSLISPYYNKNEPAITEVIKRCGYGVEGIVTDSITGEPLSATIWVNNFFPVVTKPGVGDYHKYILPGTYTIKVVANGYSTKVISNVVVPSTGSVTTNFQLARQTGRFAHQVMSSRIPITDFS